MLQTKIDLIRSDSSFTPDIICVGYHSQDKIDIYPLTKSEARLMLKQLQEALEKAKE